MQKLNRLNCLLLAFVICMSLCLSVFATDVEMHGSWTRTPVVLTTEAAQFSVTVPTGLPVNVAADGTVTVADNVKIINNSAGPVKVVGMAISAVTDWTIANYETDLRNELVDSNQIGMVINDCQTTGADAIEFEKANFTVMMAKNDGTDDECPITYNAKVTPLSEAFSTNTVANVVFTVDWDDVAPVLASGSNWYKGTAAKTSIKTINIVDSYTPDDTEVASWAADTTGTGKNQGLSSCRQ